MSTPSRRLTRAAAPVVVVPVLLAALSACGGGDSSPDSAATSASPTAGGTTSAASPSASLRGTPVTTQAFKALVKRSVDKATTARLGLQLNGSNGAITGTGQVDYRGRTPSLAVLLPGFGNADLRLIGNEVYVKVPASGGNTYFKGNLKNPTVAQQLGNLGGFDPASALVQLTEEVTRVSLVGRERLQGDAVRHYQFLADPSALEGASSSPSAGSSTVTVDAWFDGQDLLRKTHTALPDGTDVTLTLSDWGSPVHITAPPASQVKTLPMASASPSS